MRTINLFMWGYQSHFRGTIQYLAQRVLELIGIDVEPEVLLVGLARPGRNPTHPVCLEPEDGRWSLSNFSALPARVDEAIAVHPMQRHYYGDEVSMREKPENIRRLVIREEVAGRLGLDDCTARLRSYCSNAYPVDDYYVVCVIQVAEHLFRQFPAISYRWLNEDFETSFLDQCLKAVLDEAHVALSRPDPGRYISDQGMRTPAEVVASAARSFMRVPFIGNFNTSDFFENFNRLSQLMYEGQLGTGRIALAAAEDANVEYVLRLASPVSLRETRWARKLLQMATRDTPLIAGYDSIYGLGRVSGASDPLYSVDFLGHHQWQLRRGDQVLMRAQFGEARLPQEPISSERFVDNMSRIFADISEDAVGLFRTVLDFLVDLPRGSMLVIAKDAATEATRLKQQGTAIEPTKLSKELLERATSIDGTILADPNGVCHAIGVILDGAANDECTPSRGARYNSAVRYVLEGAAERMAFVVSEDRTLDVIPLLRQRVSRNAIDQAVKSISTATLDDYHKVRSWLDEHRFYLNKEQCQIVNEALDRIRSTPLEVGRIIIHTARFEPHAAMNDSYLKD